MAKQTFVDHFKGRTRLLGGAVVGVAAYVVLTSLNWPGPLRLALSWDLGVVAYLIASWGMMARSSRAVMVRRARELDISMLEIVGLTAVAAAFSLIAAARVLGEADGASGSIAAGIATIVLSWFFIHTLFAIHYAHEFHDEDKKGSGQARGGLGFPGKGEPDYWDFVYFAVVIAMTCQVSDVTAESRPMRRLVAAHGVISFFINTVIVALAVGVAASLV